MARPRVLSERALRGLDDAGKATRFLETLRIPEGPAAGQQVRLAPYQNRFVGGALATETSIAALSIARGNGKSALTAGLALGGLLPVWDRQPRRTIVLAARTREQASVAFAYAVAFAASLPDAMQANLQVRRAPRLELEYRGDGGGHVLRVIAADGKTALGTSPTLALLDERGHWQPDKGDALEAAILTGLGKRGGRALVVSTSAPDDAHAFSQLLDRPPPGAFVQEHRPAPGLPADDLASLLEANPGAEHGIGATPQWLQASAHQAIARGGNSLSAFRLYTRNERVSGEDRDVLLTVDEWLGAETEALPPREGPVVVGLDLGGSASMSAAAFYWPETARLECYGSFPSNPPLPARGERDGVADRYVKMRERGELATLGDKTVPPAAWIAATWQHIAGETVSAVVADRFKQAEVGEALDAAGVVAPVIWRGMGFRDGGEDVERFRRAVFEGKVRTPESLLMRSAMVDAIVLRDPANNAKLAKSRSSGRIDAVAATVLAVAEGVRQQARPARRPARMVWA